MTFRFTLLLFVIYASIPQFYSYADDFPILETDQTFLPVYGQKGMIASQEEVASQVGAQILSQGGNAIDAAVAVGYALAVTLPKAGNIGGGGFMVIWLNKEKSNCY